MVEVHPLYEDRQKGHLLTNNCILQILSARIVTRLRALVVLPTRDLVMQVRETFEAVAKGRGLKVSAPSAITHYL